MGHLILEFGLALGLIAIAGIFSARFHFSMVPVLILAGMVVGPHAPKVGVFDFSFIESAVLLDFMGQLGVLFLLFALGLEFAVSRLIAAGTRIIRVGIIYMAVNFTLGVALPLLLGWPIKEVLIVAGIMTISSSAIVAKMLVETKRTANPETEIILGLMMFQDVFVAVYLSIVSGLVLTGTSSLAGVLTTTGIALGFIVGFLLLGRKLVNTLNRLLDIPSDELFLLVLFAALILIAGLSETLHIAAAIGALLTGLILAETEHAERIEHLIIPFRDFFGALFFFSFGLSIDPFSLGGAVVPVLIAVVVTILGNVVSGVISGRTSNLSHRASFNIGITITSRGEFSIIMANLAKAGGLLPVLQPFSALYVLLMAILGPVMTKKSKTLYSYTAKLLNWPAIPERKREHHSIPKESS